MSIAIRPSHPYNAGTEHVGFSLGRRGELDGVVYFFVMHDSSRMTIAIRLSPSHNAGTEHVGFSLRRRGELDGVPGSVYLCLHDSSHTTIAIRPSRPYNAGTEHVGFPRTGGGAVVLSLYMAVVL